MKLDLENSQRSSDERYSLLLPEMKAVQAAQDRESTQTEEHFQELELVKADLMSIKFEKDVIKGFRSSQAYTGALDNDAASKIQRCWLVA